MRGGLFFEGNFLIRTQARIDHQREVERLLRFGFKDFDFLERALFVDLKSFDGQIGRGLAVVIKHAG